MRTFNVKQIMIPLLILLTVFTIVTLLLLSPVYATENNLIAEIHSHPPHACVSKSIHDSSSGMRIMPNGNTREQVRGVVGWMASVFLKSGKQFMTPKYIDVIYTAVFYQDKSINEVGIYGYRFNITIDESMFKAIDDFHGRIMVINDDLLLLLWHEDIRKTEKCYSALEDRLDEHR